MRDAAPRPGLQGARGPSGCVGRGFAPILVCFVSLETRFRFITNEDAFAGLKFVALCLTISSFICKCSSRFQELSRESVCVTGCAVWMTFLSSLLFAYKAWV